MLFNSAYFLVFFVFVMGTYFLVPQRYRRIVLLLSSYIFYISWELKYALLLVFVTAISYYSSEQIVRTLNPKKKKYILQGCLLTLFGLLFSFKYFNFFNDNLRALSESLHVSYPVPYIDILLPVGISFFTFEAVSYVFDIYYDIRKPEKSFLSYALFISFFPKLLAGPIERSTTLLPQLNDARAFNYSDFSIGLKRVLWGLFKKVVIADRLSVLVDMVYDNPQSYNGPTLLVISYLFALQMYCDFSGYSDIAIGLSRMLGFRLMENFNLPYLSKNVTDFWRRWHISLSTWLRDYLYTPLVFARKSLGTGALILATFVTFTLAGLWHGARWTYVFFGVLQFVAISYEILSQKLRQSWSQKIPAGLYKGLSIFLTFHFVVFSFIFFRAETISDGFTVANRILSWNLHHTDFNYFMVEAGIYPFRFSMLLLLVFILSHTFMSRLVKEEIIFRYQRPVYALITAAILLFGVFGHAGFIYFQF